MIDNVRICLCNGLDELSTCVESEKLVKKDGGVRVYMFGDCKAKVCQMVAYQSGDGVSCVLVLDAKKRGSGHSNLSGPTFLVYTIKSEK